jgi:hypothetical protein
MLAMVRAMLLQASTRVPNTMVTSMEYRGTRRRKMPACNRGEAEAHCYRVSMVMHVRQSTQMAGEDGEECTA